MRHIRVSVTVTSNPASVFQDHRKRGRLAVMPQKGILNFIIKFWDRTPDRAGKVKQPVLYLIFYRKTLWSHFIGGKQQQNLIQNPLH